MTTNTAALEKKSEGKETTMTKPWANEFPVDDATGMDSAAVRILVENMNAGRGLTVDRLRLFTFELKSGRRVTYEGINDQAAWAKARLYHSETQLEGARRCVTKRCECTEKDAGSVRQAGCLICRRGDCAGYIG